MRNSGDFFRLNFKGNGVLKVSRTLVFSLKAVIGFGLVWFLLSTGVLDLEALGCVLENPSILVLVVCFCLIMYALSALRWQLLLSCQTIDIPFLQATRLIFISLFLNCCLPVGGVGGDAVRMAYVTKVTHSRKAEAALSVVVDRFLGLFAILTVGAIASYFLLTEILGHPALRMLSLIAVSAAIAIPLLVGFLCVFVRKEPGAMQSSSAESSRFLGTVRRLAQSAVLYVNYPRKLLVAYAIAVLMQTIMIAAMVSLGGAMGLVDMTPADYAFASLWGILSNLVPLTPGGIGIGEAAFGGVSRLLIGSGSGEGVATVFLVYRLLAMLATTPGLLFWLFVKEETEQFSGSPEIS